MRTEYLYKSEKTPIYIVNTAKKLVNVAINSDLIRKARELNINLSQTLDSSLLALVRQKEHEQWVKENEDAIAEYNKRVTISCYLTG